MSGGEGIANGNGNVERRDMFFFFFFLRVIDRIPYLTLPFPFLTAVELGGEICLFKRGGRKDGGELESAEGSDPSERASERDPRGAFFAGGFVYNVYIWDAEEVYSFFFL